MGKLGGKREGAGRPKGTVAKSTAIALKLKEQMAIRLEKEFGPIMDAQLDAAKGIQTEQYNKKTGDLYYKDLGPNIFAFKTILEHVMGRPKEQIEISGNEPIQIDLRIKESLEKIYK